MSALQLLQANGDVFTADDGSVVDLATLTMMPCEVVWVPGASKPQVDAAGRPLPSRSRGSALGPNGEGPDEGRWRLRLPLGSPKHLGKPGEIYDGPALSVSAMETFSECQMKWGADRLDGLEKPKNHKAELGSARHAELAAWLTFGTRPTTPGMSKVIAHFPMPGTCESEVYDGFIVGRPGHEVIIAGYLDCREMPMVRGDDFDGTERGPINPIIRDLKTTGDFRWRKTGAQLRTANLQSASYALSAMLRSNRDVALLRWVYALITASGPSEGHITSVMTVNEEDASSKPEECSGVFLTRKEAVATVARYVVQYGEAMISAIQRGARAEEMQKNVDACSLYGGCPWLKTEPQACVPPPGGGGFRSMLAKERVRLGILTGESMQKVTALLPDAAPAREMTTAAGLGNRFAARMKNGPPVQVVEERKMSALGNRFAKLMGAPPTRLAVESPVGSTVTVTTKTTTPAPKPGLARFAKTGGSVARPTIKAPTPAEPETPKLEIKATVDGNASGGSVATPAAPSAEPGSLLERLQAMQPGNAENIAAAMTKAPSNSVTLSAAEKSKANSIGALAHGINPPDAAPEWTDEEQDEEAERIAKRSGVGGEVKEKKTPILEALPASSPTREAAVAQAQVQLEAKAEVKAEKQAAKEAKAAEKEAAKLAGTAPRRGRPPGSKNVEPVAGSVMAGLVPGPGPERFNPSMAAASIEDAIALLDDLTIALVAGKQRAAAARVADAVAALELIQAAQAQAVTP